MADNTVDTLKIRVQVDTGNSSKDLGKIVGAITRINKVASDRSLDKYQKSLNALAKASKGLFALDRAVAKLENIKITPKLKENLDKIADAGAKLASTGKGIKTFVDSLKRIDKMGQDTELDKKFDAVATSVGKFANSISNSVSDDTLRRLIQLADALERITRNANKKVRGGVINQVANSNKAVNSAITWKSIENIISKINSTASETMRSLFGIFDNVGITKDLEKMSGALSKHIPVLSELTSAWRHHFTEVRKIITSNAGIIDKASNLIIARITHLMSLLYSFAKIPFKSMGLTKGMTSLLALPFKGFVENVKELSKAWNKFTSSLARIAIYRGIRTALKEIASAIKEGTNNLYLWSQAWKSTLTTAERFANTMDTLATGVLYLKNSIGAMVSPLLDYLAPAIDALIDKFVALTNAINQAISALTGANLWRKAIRYPIEYADVMSGAKKKADDLKRTVLGFDELNRLDDNKKKSGGGGQDDWDYSKMFEEMPVSDRIKDLINAENWSSIGSLIASKINQGLASINWDSVKQNTKKWAVRFGTLFNSVLNETSMPLVGKSISEFFNTIALGINTIYDQIDFTTFGSRLADGFESFIHNAKWREWGNALTQKFKSLIDIAVGFKDVDLSGLGDGLTELIAGMFENINLYRLSIAIKSLLPKIGTELGIAINGLFKETNTAINGGRGKRGIDFTGLGESFAQGINNMLGGIDPKEAGVFLTNGLNAIIKFVGGAVNNLNWDSLNSTLGETITSMFENIDLNSAVGSAVKIAENIVRLLNTAVESIPWEKVGEAIESVDTTELKNGIKKLFENVANALERSGLLDEVVTGLGAFIGLKLGGAMLKIIPSILPAITASMGASAGAGAVGAGASGGLFATLFPVAGAVTAGSILGQQFSHHFIAPILEGMGSADADLYRNWTFFGEGGLFQASMDFAKFKAEDFEKYLFNFGSTHRAVFDDLKNGTGIFSDAYGLLHGVITGDSEEMGTSINSLKETFTLWKDSWETEHPIISAGIEAIKKVGSDAVTTLEDKFGQLEGFLGGSFLSDWKKIWGEASKSLSDAFGDMNSSVSGFLTGGVSALLSADVQFKGTSTGGKNIPKLASGGLVGQGSMFIAGEAGPELVTSWGDDSAVLNANQIVDAIANGVAMASGGDITIPVYLDGNMLDQIIVTAQQRQNIRSGGR